MTLFVLMNGGIPMELCAMILLEISTLMKNAMNFAWEILKQCLGDIGYLFLLMLELVIVMMLLVLLNTMLIMIIIIFKIIHAKHR